MPIPKLLTLSISSACLSSKGRCEIWLEVLKFMKNIFNLKAAALAIVAVCAIFASNKAEAQSAQWLFCGNEGDTCVVTGTWDIAFGSGRAWIYEYGANVPGRFICRRQTFGGRDPAPGYQKSCFVRQAAPTPPPPPPARWTYCVDEGGICRLSRPATVRYGARGSYLYLYDQVGFACTDQVFGGDPAPGRRKQCDFSF